MVKREIYPEGYRGFQFFVVVTDDRRQDDSDDSGVPSNSLLLLPRAFKGDGRENPTQTSNSLLLLLGKPSLSVTPSTGLPILCCCYPEYNNPPMNPVFLQPSNSLLLLRKK